MLRISLKKDIKLAIFRDKETIIANVRLGELKEIRDDEGNIIRWVTLAIFY
ncbi:MAG: hypothetical protein ACOX3T_06805 [Bdellovibrionota bacterium]